jgi:hypothetical protein
MRFPDNCLRGIPNDQHLLDEGRVAPHLFHFKPEQSARTDGWIEQSINWEDDSSVVEFTLNQRKENGELQFRAGVAIISRSEIDRFNGRPAISGVLSYERQRLENNPFHGNLLLREDIPKVTMKMIAAGIACLVSSIVPQNRG